MKCPGCNPGGVHQLNVPVDDFAPALNHRGLCYSCERATAYAEKKMRELDKLAREAAIEKDWSPARFHYNAD